MPRVSSFFWIGVALVAIGLFALYKGPGFMFDPGVTPEPHEAAIYLLVGVIMMVNGFIHSSSLFEEQPVGKPAGTQAASDQTGRS